MIRFLDRYSDIALAVAVVAMVGMLVVPLPTALVDVLLTLNIAVAVTLLLASTYVRSALRISALPAILLLTTLFRLALNVSTTRLILLQADAGQVIDAFGSFVVQGNVVVGAVIFLILTIIQFVVIAKGSERVAEVAARFTLDAMPGRQMAIDADLRSGAIGLDEAQRRRRALQRESKLYGAMDGAMKFVKGDAIAGIVITTVNIVAGLAIGVWQQGMPLGEAVEVYSLLTIGDGLVSQIPAILIATTAGLVVTRVSSTEDGAHLAREIGSQILEHPKAIAITAGLLFLFAVLPGLPFVPFLLLAIFMGLLARNLFRLAASQEDSDELFNRPSNRAQDPNERITVRCSKSLLDHFDEKVGRKEMNHRIGELQQRIYEASGVELPRVFWVATDSLTQPGTFEVAIDEVPALRSAVDLDCSFVTVAYGEMVALGVEPSSAMIAASSTLGYWVAKSDRPTLMKHNIEYHDALGAVMTVLQATAEAHFREFMGVQTVQTRLDEIEQTQPALVHAVVPKKLTVSALTEVLGRLLDEGVAVRDLPRILETVARVTIESQASEFHAVETAVERVRQGLKRQLSHQHTKGSGRLSAYLLDRPVEDMIRSALRETENGTVLDLDSSITSEILGAIDSALTGVTQTVHPPIFLTKADIRPHLKKLVSVGAPNCVVLSYQELLSDVQVESVGKIVVGRPI